MLHKIITDILRIWLPVLDHSQGWPCIAHSCVHVTVYATNIPSYSDQDSQYQALHIIKIFDI